jgi:hypothetical protein
MSDAGRVPFNDERYDRRVVVWLVPVTLLQSEKHELLSPQGVWDLANSLPGGGTGSSGGQGYVIGPRRFTRTVEVEAENEEQAELAARSLVSMSIDVEQFPGWDILSAGPPRPA